jgi:spermidine synthase
VELLADADRPGGWLLLIDRIRQSYVDLDDPTYLDFEYVRSLADVLDLLPPGRLAVIHVGGGGATLARYVAATRPGSPQIVLEPDTEVTALVRARLGVPRGLRVRAVAGRDGVAELKDASADVLVLDAFAGGRVPGELTTVEFLADVARVLRADGVLLANVADGRELAYTRRLASAASAVFGAVVLRSDPAVLKGRRFGNVVLAASRSALPVDGIAAVAARAMFPQRVLAGAELKRFVGRAAPLTDADPMRSPEPPDELWRVGG